MFAHRSMVHQLADDRAQALREIGGILGTPALLQFLGDAFRRDLEIAYVAGELAGRKAQQAALVAHWSATETRAAEAHAVYQREAHRRGDVRHPDAYADLSEDTKEWDRVFVRWVATVLAEYAVDVPAGPKGGY